MNESFKCDVTIFICSFTGHWFIHELIRHKYSNHTLACKEDRSQNIKARTKQRGNITIQLFLHALEAMQCVQCIVYVQQLNC